MTTEEVVKATPENNKNKVHCAHKEMVEISAIREHPKNPNHHDREQIEILANVIKSTGWRTPIGISKRSNYIIRGHGRFAAAKALGLTHVPVDYQEYENEAQELADLLADNKIADLGQIDYEGVSGVLKEIPPEQQLFTGFRDFEIAPLMMAEWIKPALAQMPESIFSYKFSVNEVQNEALRTAIKIIQSKTAKTLTDGECLLILANHYLGKTIVEEAKAEAEAPKSLAQDLPRSIKNSAPVPIVAPTVVVDTVGAPRTFLVERVTSCLWGDIDAHVIVSVDGFRGYTDDRAVIDSARSASEKKQYVRVKVEEREKTLWVTSLQLAPIAVEEKANVG